jgi:TPR repeat protein
MPLALWLALVPGSTAAAEPPQGLEQMRAFAKRLLVNEQYPDAINTYIAIVEQTPEDPRSRYELAGAMVFLRMYPDAIPHLEKAIALEPENTVYLELAGLTYIQLEQFENAFRVTLRGAELGDIKAMYAVAGMYEHGRGTPASPLRALEWLERSARAGHMGAMDGMARVYREGLYGQAPDPARVESWSRELERAMAR